MYVYKAEKPSVYLSALSLWALIEMALLNQADRLVRAWLLKIDPMQIFGMRVHVCVCVCMCVCVCLCVCVCVSTPVWLHGWLIM